MEVCRSTKNEKFKIIGLKGWINTSDHKIPLTPPYVLKKKNEYTRNKRNFCKSFHPTFMIHKLNLCIPLKKPLNSFNFFQIKYLLPTTFFQKTKKTTTQQHLPLHLYTGNSIGSPSKTIKLFVNQKISTTFVCIHICVSTNINYICRAVPEKCGENVFCRLVFR